MNISEAVRAVCLGFPEAEESQSHSMVNFKAGGRTFATYALNHHGDGRVALWLAAGPGSQQLHTAMDPENYFVPPYVGPKGWLGVVLNGGLDWDSIIQRVREAYLQTAPDALRAALGDNPVLTESVQDLAPEQIDPLLAPAVAARVARIGDICEALPESAPDRQFGNPVWKAGKKTFACVHRYEGELCLQIWVGAERQAFLEADARFRIPAYLGHRGWIDLLIEHAVDWNEVEGLIEGSYRHFALKRMLRLLDKTSETAQ